MRRAALPDGEVWCAEVKWDGARAVAYASTIAFAGKPGTPRTRSLLGPAFDPKATDGLLVTSFAAR
ncbi:hypothetical protein Misp02_41010 [Microtetraspora sp. NBRC 16547]|nr:hypothetical protein Misp02_41010 [Microtetraspora sp. NBRC 16547]